MTASTEGSWQRSSQPPWMKCPLRRPNPSTRQSPIPTNRCPQDGFAPTEVTATTTAKLSPGSSPGERCGNRLVQCRQGPLRGKEVALDPSRANRVLSGGKVWHCPPPRCGLDWEAGPSVVVGDRPGV